MNYKIIQVLGFLLIAVFLTPFVTSAAIGVTWTATSTTPGYISPNTINGYAPGIGVTGNSNFNMGTNSMTGFGSSSPYANIAIHANNGELTKYLFAIGSSTQTATTTLFSVSNTGSTTIALLGSGIVGSNNGTLYSTASSTMFGTGTGGQVLAWSNGVPTWVATSSIQNGIASIALPGSTLTGALTFATSTTGTDFTITNTGNTINFNLPVASATVSGKLSSTDWNTFNNKISSSSLASIFPFTPTTAFGSAANATSTLIGFLNGIYATASSTIGNGTQQGGLTINGGATTTGNAYFAGKIGIQTLTPSASAALDVNGRTFVRDWLYLQNGITTVTTGANLSVGATGQTGSLSFNTTNGNNKMNITNLGYVGVGSSTPWAKFSINALNGESTTTLFAIASSTQTATSSLFLVDNVGHTYKGGTTPTLSAGSFFGIANDNVGTVLTDTTAATIFTLTFANPWYTAPACTANFATTTSAIAVDTTTTSAVFTFPSVTNVKLHYHCSDGI